MARARSVVARPRERSTSASGIDSARWGTPTSTATRPADRQGPRWSFSSHGPFPEEISQDVTFDFYIWKSPRDLDTDQTETLLTTWHEDGSEFAKSPFEPSTDVGWF